MSDVDRRPDRAIDHQVSVDEQPFIESTLHGLLGFGGTDEGREL
ncbi:hypothetical protein [Stieleria varia]|nr:hypothetical protein [Stieleria varia]